MLASGCGRTITPAAAPLQGAVAAQSAVVTTGTITKNGSTYTVSGNHTYTQTNTFHTTVVISHDVAPTTTVMGTVLVVLPANWTTAPAMQTPNTMSRQAASSQNGRPSRLSRD